MKRALIVAVCGIVALAAWVFYGPIPKIDSGRFSSITIVDRDGVPLYEPLSAAGSRGEWLDSRAVPRRVYEATVAAEDKRFERHIGVDPFAIARAALHDLRRGAIVEGGSTITQQVAKLMLANGQSPHRGFARKIRETIVALRLERRYTKRAILAAYVNLAPYGNNIHGIARASRRYFGCAPNDLTAAQAAFLASLPQRPGAFNPLRDPHAAAARQLHVLRRMRSLGFIGRQEFDVARRERLRFDRGEGTNIAQHFVERVLDRVGQVLQPVPSAEGQAAKPVLHGEIVTTLDGTLQREVEGIIAAHRDDLLRHGAHSVAVAVLDNATGEWLAWEGSGDYFGSNFGGAIDGVVALRQPGSTLKPFTYALAFEHGDSPATVLPDVAANFPTAEEGVVYSPRNYDGRYRGPLRARLALAGSENVPAVALLSRFGTPALLRLLHSAGFSDLLRTADYYGLGLTLGDAEVKLEQLVAGYAIFARGGVWIEPTMIISPRVGQAFQPVPFAEGQTGKPVPHGGRRIVSKRTAFWITDILSDPAAREFIFGRGGSLDFPFAVAAKTGTSQAYHDNWTIGYTRDVTVGVWVGNFGREQLHDSSGITGAAPIFHDVVLAAERRRHGVAALDDLETIVDPPAGVVRAPVCALSGLRPSTSCPAVENEWVPADAPVEFCSWHHADGVRWPDEYRAWAKANGMLEPQLVASKAAGEPRGRRDLRIVNPPDGATYLIDPTLRMHFQTLRLRAVSRGKVAWNVDQRSVGRASRDGSIDWPLAAGKHTITAVDDEGNRSSVRIFVK